MTPREAAAHIEQARRRNERAEAANAREDQWLAWAAGLREDEVEGGGDDPHSDEILAAGLAEVQGWCDAKLAAVAEAARRETGVLRRCLAAAEAANAAERRRRVMTVAALRQRLDAAEAAAREDREACAALAKGLASLQREIAKDRAMRRLADSRREYPRAQQADLLRARRATDRAIGGKA